MVSVSCWQSQRISLFCESFDSNPASIRSTSTRFALVFCVFASDRTRFAIRPGIDTLCRTDFSVSDISPFYTALHRLYFMNESGGLAIKRSLKESSFGDLPFMFRSIFAYG